MLEERGPTTSQLANSGIALHGPDGTIQPAKASASEYKIKEAFLGEKRPLRVVFMGMGAAGIDFSYHLARTTQNVDLTIYEKNPELGGTWYENRYPGCACDIPSPAYQYTWALNPNWSKYYSGSGEIFQYFKDVATKHNLQRFTQFNSKIIRAEWLDDTGKWKITIQRGSDPSDIQIDYADVFLNGGGFLNTWKWPDIEGLHTFHGPKLHSANWDDQVDLKDKRVLVVGAGSSGVQIVPTILPQVQSLHVVARSPTWITAGFAPRYAGPEGRNFEYSEGTKNAFREDPDLYRNYVKGIESELTQRFKFVVNDTPEAAEAREFSIAEMARKLTGKPELIDTLMPKNFGVGCRRPTPGNGFLEALCEEKTTVWTQNIQKITPTGYVAHDGSTHDVDIIICATGFDTSFCPQFPVICNGRNLQDDFKGETVGYLGLNQPEVPNYFSFSGPYGPLGHGSALPMIEAYTQYILQVIEKMQTEDIKKLQVKRSVAEQFTKHSDTFLKRTAWSGPCSSWFKAGVAARKPTLWPGSRIHYLTVLQRPRFEDYEISYFSDNMWNFLGNGFEKREHDGRDLTWYYGLNDGKDVQPDSFPEPMY